MINSQILRYNMLIIALCMLSSLHAIAQQRTVENRPYTDLRPFHFGIVAGTHFQDLEFVNVGMQIITKEDGTTGEALITCDQDRWDNGFTVGIVGELRLNKSFQFRVAPAMYFLSARSTPFFHVLML